MRYFFSWLIFTGCNSSDEGIKIYNSDPVATITSHSSGDVLLEGTTYTFVGMVSDDNHNTSDLTVSWSTDVRDLCIDITPDLEGTTSCQAVLEAGESKLKLQVIDPEGAGAITTLDITVQDTQAPTITLLSPTADSLYYADQLIEFAAIIADAEDEAVDLQYQWESNQDGVLSISSPPDTDGSISGFSALSQGQHAITLRVEDSTGKTTSQNVAIQVGGTNTEPICSINAPSSGQGFTFNQNITFQGSASDADINNSLLDIAWTSDIDGTINTTAPNSDGEVAFVYDALTMGNHTITLSVADEVGGLCTDTVLLSVGTPPTLTINQPLSGAIVSYGESVFFEGTVSDQEDIPSDITLTWNSDIDGLFSTQGADSYGNIAFGYPSFSPGTHNITITATDSDALSATYTQTLHINTPPPAPTVSISPTNPTPNDDLSVVVVENPDEDGDPITYTYVWLKNGVSTSYNSTTVPASATNGNEIWTVQVTPNDGYADGDMAESSVTLTNSAPVITDVSITPSPPYNDSTLTCTVQANDPDNDPLTTTYEWNNTSTGTALGTGSTIALTPSIASRNDVISCAVVIEDPMGETDTSSQNTTLQNRAPNTPVVSISPNPAYFDSALVCNLSASGDPDGDTTTETYSWLINSTAQTENSNTLSTGFGVGDTVGCQAVSNDGLTNSNAGSSSIVITNAPPILSSVVIFPSSPKTTETIGATIQYTEPEGQPVTETYEWSVNGTIVQTGSTPSLDPSFFSKGDAIVVSVVVNDGIDSSTPMDDNVTVINTIPSEPIIDITPASPIEQTDDLLCSITSLSTDDDADPITYQFLWTFDGISYTGANSTGLSSTVSATETNQGELWACQVIPNDGEDDGNPAEIDVLINPDTFDSCLSIYNANPTSADGVYSIDINSTGIEVDVYCDMTNGGVTYQDFGMGNHSAAYSGWEVLGTADFANLQVASALSYYYNRQQLTTLDQSWNSSNCCFLDPSSTNRYYGFAGSTYMYPADSSSEQCNTGYTSSSYYFSGEGNTIYSTLSPSDILNVGTYSSCATANNPGIFVQRWY